MALTHRDGAHFLFSLVPGALLCVWLRQFGVGAADDEMKHINYTFPEDFLWGAATSAYQIEGAALEDGKGPSIWDIFTREPDRISNNQTADESADSYHKYLEDVAALRDLGVKTYRFSISWPRVIPAGIGDTNQDGIDYYHNLIDALLDADIKPMVTLYHWDLPQALQDRGGWLNPEIVDWFEEYARLCFEEYGEKVPYWITLNEPRAQAAFGYLATHHMMLGHARVYHLYDDEFRSEYNGQVGIANAVAWTEPEDPDSEEDQEAARLYRDIQFGLYTQPLITGDYPERAKEKLAELSTETGRVTSVLPEFTTAEKRSLRGSIDFFGVNHYFTYEARALDEEEMDENNTLTHLGLSIAPSDDWKRMHPDAKWFILRPAGFFQALMHLDRRLGGLPIIVTENGCMDSPGEGRNDVSRVHYLNAYISAMALAMEKGANVVGYTVWSLIDNFEWTRGYDMAFGLYRVNFNSEEKRRTPKLSARWYKSLISQNEIEITEETADEVILPAIEKNAMFGTSSRLPGVVSAIAVLAACAVFYFQI
ncbi:unnamed protein product, partial [Mesorhabditis spiculigera]